MMFFVLDTFVLMYFVPWIVRNVSRSRRSNIKDDRNVRNVRRSSCSNLVSPDCIPS